MCGVWFGRKTEDDRAATIQLLSIIKSFEMLSSTLKAIGVWFGRKTEDDRAPTIQLLSIIKSSEMLPKFKRKGFVDSSTWKAVAGLVSDKYDLGSNPCKKVQDRYNYLLKNYRAWKDNSTKTGARYLKKHDFFLGN